MDIATGIYVLDLLSCDMSLINAQPLVDAPCDVIAVH